MNMNVLKIIGLVTSVVGAGANIVASIIADKKTDIIIGEKVVEEITKHLKK